LLERYCPGLGQVERDAVSLLAAGSIGRALDFAGSGGVDLYRSVLTLLARPQGIDPAALHAFTDRLGRPEAEDAYRTFEDLIVQLVARLARHVADAAIGQGPAAELAIAEKTTFRDLAGHRPATTWAELREQLAESFARTDALNLDRKQTVMGAF